MTPWPEPGACDSEVYAEPVFCGPLGRRGRVDGLKQVEGAAAVNKIGLPAPHSEPIRAVEAEDDGDKDATTQGKDADAVGRLVRQDSFVVGHGSVRLEGRLNAFVALVGFARLADAPHGHLGRQTELSTNAAVDERPQPDLVGGALRKGDLGDDIAGRVERLHGTQVRKSAAACSGSGSNFTCTTCFMIIPEFMRTTKGGRRGP